MASNVQLAKNVQVSKLKFSAPKTLNNGSRSVYVNYEGDKLTIQTPIMSLPYGIGDFNDKPAGGKDSGDSSNFKKYDMHVSFRGMDESKALKSLHDKMLEIEKRIKDECFNNRLTWLKDDYDGMKTVVDRLFWPIVKIDKDKETGKPLGKYPPTMKLKLPYDNTNDTFQFDCRDMDGNEFDFKSNMTKLKHARARLLIQLGGLWFAGGKYGCTWKVVKAHIETANKANVDFIEDSDDDSGVVKETHSDEDVEEDALHMASASQSHQAKKNTTYVPSSDDEDEPAPPPAPVKKTKAPPARVPSPEPEENEDENDEEVEAEDNDVDPDSDIEDVPPPPPPPKKPAAKKATTTTKK